MLRAQPPLGLMFKNVEELEMDGKTPVVLGLLAIRCLVFVPSLPPVRLTCAGK